MGTELGLFANIFRTKGDGHFVDTHEHYFGTAGGDAPLIYAQGYFIDRQAHGFTNFLNLFHVKMGRRRYFRSEASWLGSSSKEFYW